MNERDRIDDYIERLEEKVGALTGACRAALKILQEQPGGCEHKPTCFYQVKEETMRDLRNRLALAIERAEQQA